ncbi:MAG: hypothetical protein BAJALOKI1v1_1370008 [Promethearchaeota archaeon]|nr:MAG: hypothetical protein BAJALOKI1v1_1370008 [Candidatus Lokiarchaeota archaeon]
MVKKQEGGSDQEVESAELEGRGGVNVGRGRVLIGTSGWSYDEDWVGSFYPKSLKGKDFFTYYAEIFYTTEINTTFYQIPSRAIVEGWAEKSPEDFVFSAKLPNMITHKARLALEECWTDLEAFLDVMDPLVRAGKLLAFLIQLPPSFNRREHFSVLKEFIERWPANYREEGYELVVEFRNISWMTDEVFRYLHEAQLSYCGVIEPLLPARLDLTNKRLSYIRFHGFGKDPWFNYQFSNQEIKKYAEPIRAVIPRADTVSIYFNNHFSGYAPKNSLMLMKELNIEPRKRPSEVDLLEIKKKSGEIAEDQTSLDKFLH